MIPGVFRYSLVAIMMSGAAPREAYAENRDLSVLVSRTSHDRNTATIQFTVKNNTQNTIYIRDGGFEQGQAISLNSGDRLKNPEINGIEICRHDMNNCLGQNGTDINEYSSIDAGQILKYDYLYHSIHPFTDDETASFTVTLIVRQSNGSLQPRSPRLERFPFHDISLEHQ